MKILHPIRSYRNFNGACTAKYASFIVFCFASLEAVRALTASINAYDLHVSELHAEIKKIERSVGYLQRAKAHQRETQGQKVSV